MCRAKALHSFLDSHNIAVVSARDKWGHRWPREPIRWKLPCFLEVVDVFKADNIIVVGDGKPEMQAAKKLKAAYPRALVKSVKFRDVPSIDDLLQQIDWVTKNAFKIVACYHSIFCLAPPTLASMVVPVESLVTLPDDMFSLCCSRASCCRCVRCMLLFSSFTCVLT